MSFLLVGLGGALGSVARYGFYRLLPPPLGTMGVNIVGGFLMGLLVGWLTMRGNYTEGSRLFFGVGVLGGFTTFSTVAVETVLLAQRRRRDWAWVNLLGTFLVCLVAAAVGLTIGGLFPR